jgi:hypothetical protein
MNDIKLLSAFLTFCQEKNFIDSIEVTQNAEANSYCFDYRVGNNYFKLFSDLNMSKVELQHNNEVIFLKSSKFSDVLRLVTEKISYKKDVEIPAEIYESVKGIGLKRKLVSAIIFPVGIHKKGIIYSDANGQRYLHQEEGRVSLGFWKMFWDAGEEYSFLAMPKLYNVSSDLDYDVKTFEKSINSSYSDYDILSYNYPIKNSIDDYLEKAYGRIFLTNGFMRDQYLMSDTDTYSVGNIQDKRAKDYLQWSIVSSVKDYLGKSMLWSMSNPHCVIMSGVKNSGEWKLDFSFQSLVHSSYETKCAVDYSVIMSERDFNVYRDILSEKTEMEITDNGVFIRLKSTVITNRPIIQRLYKLCSRLGKRQEIKSAKNLESQIKDTYYLKVVDIDVDTKIPIVEVYKNSEFHIKETMNIVLAKFRLKPEYSKFNELKFIDCI